MSEESPLDPARRPLRWLIWGILLVTLTAIIGAYTISLIQTARTPALPVIGELPDFTLTNQASVSITKSSLIGAVTLADIVFTRCMGPCPEMTRKMSAFQKSLPRDASIRFLTLTTDPGYDSPAVLQQYASRFGADSNRWWFVTGMKSEIVKVAMNGLKLVAQEKQPQEQTTPEDLFIHSTMFVVLDKKGRLRGAFDSYEPDFQKKVRAAIKQLLKEHSS
jgi:cytochrome oxidase Cu insertion factor (SCO1/SenC/PrrC family)